MDRKLSLLGFAVMFLIGSDTFVVAPLLPSLAKTFEVSTSRSGWRGSRGVGDGCVVSGINACAENLELGHTIHRPSVQVVRVKTMGYRLASG